MNKLQRLQTVETVETVYTEDLKKYESLSYSLTDNLKARDASTSKNTYIELWKLCSLLCAEFE